MFSEETLGRGDFCGQEAGFCPERRVSLYRVFSERRCKGTIAGFCVVGLCRSLADIGSLWQSLAVFGRKNTPSIKYSKKTATNLSPEKQIFSKKCMSSSFSAICTLTQKERHWLSPFVPLSTFDFRLSTGLWPPPLPDWLLWHFLAHTGCKVEKILKMFGKNRILSYLCATFGEKSAKCTLTNTNHTQNNKD